MTIVVGHRGAAAHAPENTLESFRTGVEMGADAIELDVHLTADGQLAVIHDDTLDRTTDRTGSVATLTMDEIREADAGARFARDEDSGHPFASKGLTVPTLGEVLDWLPEDVGLVIEIKARAAPDAVVEAVSDRPVRSSGRLSVISFDERVIDRVRELDPEIKTGYLLVPSQPIHEAILWATDNGHVGVHPWEGDLAFNAHSVLADAVMYGREMGCYVVNDSDRMLQLAALGLWGFVTDVPDVARETMGPRAG
ncbi:MAG TPA: glycerophosphodiester phosphodiesterase family protein [Candidatus Limnocylindria bacterium]|jgi:glycerophosphoryl diester phosphodiesterase